MSTRQKILLLMLVVLVFLSGCGIANKGNTSPSNTGSTSSETLKTKLVHIDSDPQGATVFIDNDAPVETPVEYKFTFGTHFITFRKEGYYDFVKKDVTVDKGSKDIFVTLVEVPQDERHLTEGPILFDSVPHFACCSAAAIAYSNIFYGETRTISGLTTLDSFDFVFPSGKKVHFDTEKASKGERKFSKVVTFDELGDYEIISNGEHKYSFEVCYKAKILPGTPVLEEIFPDYNVKNAIAVPNGKEVTVKLLITDTKGDPIRNTPLSVYDLKTDKNGVVTFKVSVKGEDNVCCPEVFVNGKPAEVRIYANILAWGYESALFTRDGHLIESSIPEVKKDAKVIIHDNDVYMPYGSFGLSINEIYYSDSSSRNNNIVTPLKDPPVIYTDTFVSKDSGAHWEKLGMSFDTIAVDPNKSNVLYGWSEINPYNISALFKSEDYGLHFAKIEDIEFVKQIVVDPNDSNTLYLATYKGLFKSNDGGKTWDHMVDPRSGNVEFVAVSPENSNVVLASTGMGLYKSEDQGKTWEKISLVKNQPPEWNIPNCIVFDPANPGPIYAGTENTLFVSKDAGESWEKLGIFGFFGRETIAVDPTSPNKIYIYSYGKGIYKSEDYGKHFTKIDFPLNLTDVGITVNSFGEVLMNENGIPLKINSEGKSVPLGGETFLKNGPKWEIIDNELYIAVNTIKSLDIGVHIKSDAISFYKLCDMLP